MAIRILTKKELKQVAGGGIIWTDRKPQKATRDGIIWTG
jgi:bacteriocin-like protein